MHIVGKLVCIGVVATLTGCSTVKSWFGQDQRNVPAALVDFKSTMAVRSAWSSSIGSAKDFTFAPALSGNSLFVAAADGSVAKLDAATGRTVWRINAGMRLTAGVGSDGHTIAVVGEKGVIRAYDEQGTLLWKVQTTSEVLSAPAVGEALVIVRSVDNRISAFDSTTGVQRWTLQRSIPPLTLRAAPGIVIVDQNAYVALPGGKLVALALSNGGPIWEATVGDSRGTTELERMVDVSGLPAVLRDDVCAVSYQGSLACFDKKNGTQHWIKKLSSYVGIALDERFVFAADALGVANAYTRETGQSVWRNQKLANRRLSTPVSFGRAVAFGDAQGYIHFLSREDGSFLARFGTDGSSIINAPLIAGSNLIVQTQSGTVIAIATE